MRRRLALLALLAAAGCAGDGGLCGGRDIGLVNASSLGVEQVSLGTGAPNGWGADLLGQRPALPQGAAMTLPAVGGARTQAVRVVWVNGRAAELGGLDGCRFQRLVVQDGGMRAE